MQVSWRNVRLILHREVRDQLRDRRTLFMIAVLPLLLYPAMAIGMMQMKLLFSEQKKTVVILGADHLPSDPGFLTDSKIDPRWFTGRTGGDSLRILTEESLDRAAVDPRLDAEMVTAQWETAESLRDDLRRQQNLQAKLNRLRKNRRDDMAQEQSWEQEVAALETRLERLREESGRRLRAAGIDVLLIVPNNFSTDIANAINSKPQGESAEYARILPIHNRADEASQLAFSQVSDALRGYERAVRQRIQSEAGLPEMTEKPVFAEPVDLAQSDEVAASVWSKLFPAILIIMAITGAFYPAIDLAAGEKERGTMETLLISPARRSEIVLGKFLTVLAFSIATATLNLVSMAFTGQYLSGMVSDLGGASISLPPLTTFLWVPVLLVPIAALFSALSLALATFAKSSKEGQYYLTPMLMVVMGMTLFAMSPGIEITPLYSLLPVIGPGLLLKQLLTNPDSAATIVYVVPVLVASVGYSLMALLWAIDQFASEDVLFRDAERFDLRLWVRHLFRDKETRPSTFEAGACFGMIIFLQFAAIRFAQSAMAGVPPGGQTTRMLQLLITQQIVIIACPALFMGLLLTTDPLGTFRLRRPSLRYLGIGLLLPIALHPLVIRLQDSLGWFFGDLPLPEGARATLEAMGSSQVSLPLLFLAIAVAPAICEEIAFRGFILSGLKQSGRVWVAVLGSALAFGLVHMIPQQVFNATLLGILLGLLAVKSRSLLPGILFHLVNNGLAIGHSRYGQTLSNADGTGVFLKWENGVMLYRWPVLVIALIVAGALITSLVRKQTDDKAFGETESELLNERGAVGTT